MPATVEIAGYTMVSGSKLLLKDMNVNFTVINVIRSPKDRVATITVKIAGKSPTDTPQNRVPKTIAMALIVALVARVKTTMAPINL